MSPLTFLTLSLIGCAMDAPVLSAAPALPVLSVDLGPENRGVGLVVPSAGDGINHPTTIDGVAARETDRSQPSYLYVRLDHPAYQPGPRDVYVTVEVFDDSFRRVQIQYDKANPEPTLASKYTPLPNPLLLTGSHRWVRQNFLLPQVRMAHGQNNGADFRLSGSGLIIRRIEVSAERPQGFRESGPFDAAALDQLRVRRQPGMELTFGSDAGPAEAQLLHALSVTSVESYVDWAGVEPEKGKWDWRKWDEQVATLKAAGVKWVPFLLVGMPYATPLWFQHSDRSAYFVCLEHGKESRVQSLFNPHLPAMVDRYLAAFAERYRDSGVLESVLLGVSGIYGESLYPAGPEGGWTARLTGPYHNHLGWWAGDPLAVAAFREAMSAKYGTVAALNRAWGTRHGGFESVTTFLPDKAPNDRARADMAQWYQQAMTDWSALWVRLARKHFPQTEIYLCTGGRGTPELGADFTAQAKAIAPFGAGIRITNEGSDYAGNFVRTQEAATATSFYRTFAGFEPAGKVNAVGVVARIYNATAAGIRQLHFYHPNVLGSTEALANFRANVKHLVPRQPRTPVAAYVSRETWELDAEANGRLYAYLEKLRDVCDFDLVTRTTVADGALRQYRALVLLESAVLEPASATRIADWVRAGGLLIVGDGGVGTRLHDCASWRSQCLAPGAADAVSIGYALTTPAPDRWTLEIGSTEDENWLFGDWRQREEGREWNDIPNARKRWSGAQPGIRLPVRPGVDYTLRIDAVVPGQALAPPGGEVLVNGRTIGRLTAGGPRVLEFAVPAQVLGEGNVAPLTVQVKTWTPADQGSTDTRRLGIAVHRVELFRQGAADATPQPCALEPAVKLQRPAALARRVGNGLTVNFSASLTEPATFALLAADALLHTDRYPGTLAPVLRVDGRADGRYATVFAEGTLWYEGRGGIAWE